MLVTVARYRTVTLDTTSGDSAVTGALIDAQALLEEDLGGRPLESAERTERMYPNTDGRMFPRATPVTVVPAGYVLDGATILGGSPFFGQLDLVNPASYIDLTYTGGFVERSGNPTATNRLPQHVETDLCWAAYRQLRPSALSSAIPVGANSVRLGDAAVGFGAGGGPQGADATTGWSKATLALRRRRI